MLRISSSGTGSGLSRRIARVEWMISNTSVPSGIPCSFSLWWFEPDRDGGAGDHRDISRFFIGDIETAFDDVHGDLTMRQRPLYDLGVDLRRLLNADRDLDLHHPRIDPERADKGQRAVVHRVFDRADRGLGVVAAVQIVAAAHLENDAFSRHCHRPHGRSSRTTAAALAITVELVPASLAISSPPSTTRTVPVPCGNTASTASLSTRSGRGTPIVTSTCITSTGRPTASATLSPLCQSASRNARTAALV